MRKKKITLPFGDVHVINWLLCIRFNLRVMNEYHVRNHYIKLSMPIIAQLLCIVLLGNFNYCIVGKVFGRDTEVFARIVDGHP
jgi:hypothetical protein